MQKKPGRIVREAATKIQSTSSKKRNEKIAYIRNPENYSKPWTKTQIDAELEAKKHELLRLHEATSARDVAANEDAEDAEAGVGTVEMSEV